jgi:catechol 2,3-dioxygenase-like lactoylglutathione lyase family enzyme
VPVPIIDHISLGVANLAASKAFYDSAFAALGIAPHRESADLAIYARDGMIGFSIHPVAASPRTPIKPPERCHYAFAAVDRKSVDAFHAAALKAGGRDGGPPGLRPEYHPNYYAAYVIDPDGYHIEAVCHTPEMPRM